MSDRDTEAWRKLLAQSQARRADPTMARRAKAGMKRLRSRAISTVERGAASDMRADYEATVRAGMRRAEHMGSRHAPLSEHEAHAVLGVAKALSREMVGDIGAALSRQIETIKREAQNTTRDFLATMHPEIPRAAEMAQGGAHGLTQEALAKLGEGLGDAVAAKFGETLSGGIHMAQALDALQDSYGAVWYQVERFVRTEGSFAFNATCRAAIEEAAELIPGLGMRWTEYCDDEGNPLDMRVADDSILMHGQICSAGGVFVFPDPDGPGTSSLPTQNNAPMANLVGRSWAHPPNRPNDRATISPWLPEYGVVGWTLINGKRVEVNPT